MSLLIVSLSPEVWSIYDTNTRPPGSILMGVPQRWLKMRCRKIWRMWPMMMKMMRMRILYLFGHRFSGCRSCWNHACCWAVGRGDSLNHGHYKKTITYYIEYLISIPPLVLIIRWKCGFNLHTCVLKRCWCWSSVEGDLMVGVGGVPRGGSGGGWFRTWAGWVFFDCPFFFFFPNSLKFFGGCGIGPALGGPLRRGWWIYDIRIS